MSAIEKLRVLVNDDSRWNDGDKATPYEVADRAYDELITVIATTIGEKPSTIRRMFKTDSDDEIDLWYRQHAQAAVKIYDLFNTPEYQERRRQHFIEQARRELAQANHLLATAEDRHRAEREKLAQQAAAAAAHLASLESDVGQVTE